MCSDCFDGQVDHISFSVGIDRHPRLEARWFGLASEIGRASRADLRFKANRASLMRFFGCRSSTLARTGAEGVQKSKCHSKVSTLECRYGPA
jgi:hypothetical protein